MGKFNLSDVISGAVSKLDTGAEEFQRIDVRLIDPNPDNFFSVEDDQTDLAESIRVNGLLQPLVVTPADGGRYRCIAGHRRRAAVLTLVAEDADKWAFVPCKVTRPSSHELEELMLIQTNTEAREIGWHEKNTAAERVEKILVKLQQEQKIDLPGKMRANVARIIKASESQIARAKFIADHLDDDVRARITKARGDVSDDAAYRLAHLAVEQQRELCSHYKDNMWQLTTSNIKKYTDNIAAGRKPFYIAPQVRLCYLQKEKNGVRPVCSMESTMTARRNRADLLKHEKCGGYTDCCNNCDYRTRCADCCPIVAKNNRKKKTPAAYFGDRLRALREAHNVDVTDIDGITLGRIIAAEDRFDNCFLTLPEIACYAMAVELTPGQVVDICFGTVTEKALRKPDLPKMMVNDSELRVAETLLKQLVDENRTNAAVRQPLLYATEAVRHCQRVNKAMEDGIDE